jgi:alanine dehydrogenase
MTLGRLIYISDAEIKKFSISQRDFQAAICKAFVAYGSGQAKVIPASHLDFSPGHGFRSLCAAWEEAGFSSNKWFGITPVQPGLQGAGIHALLTLNDYKSGIPLAIMGANQITGWRTASMSALVASRLANPQSKTLGFIGCGLQARMHLDSLLSVLPEVNRVLAFSRSLSSSQAFVGELSARSITAEALISPKDVVRQSDIVVSSVPLSSGLIPFLDPDWIQPGTFVCAVDLARSWLTTDLHRLETRITDDHRQQAMLPPISHQLGPMGTFSCDLAELVSGRFVGGFDPNKRAIFIFRGSGLADLAIAIEVYKCSRRLGYGVELER